MSSASPLSKSQYLRGLQCRKSLWLYRNRKDLLPETPPSLQMIFDQGHEVGKLAWKRFPEGVLIEADHLHPEDALQATAAAAKSGANVLYEAAALFDRVLIRADILARNDAQTWDMVEVKSSADIKDVYLHDLAIQRHVLEGAGFPIGKTFLMHINTDYVRLGGIDAGSFFTLRDLTEEIKGLIKSVPEKVRLFQATAALDSAPEIDIGPHCSAPYDCEFTGHCWRHIPGYSVYDVVRISGAKVAALRGLGILEIKDIPDGFALSDAQRLQVLVEKSGRPHVDAPEIAGLLNELEYPLHFLDFETVNPAIPPYDGLRPFQQIPFQASLHLLMSPGAPLQHMDFLGDGKADPREGLAAWLAGAIGAAGAVIAYNAAFEGRCLKDLAQAFPARGPALESIQARLWDIAAPFRKGLYVHPGFRGSWSMKSVLPALAPGMSYANLAIADGAQAQSAYLRMMRGDLSQEAAQETRRALREYCGQDTLGMVEILRRLEEIGGGREF
ncbi:MAG: hypothetical protein A3G41_06660 [Elusimicrobia bacterium RIFCSPLOWO2_12_FULL_59_9]|nr:MAG: hypothetical protein A3G41_06660 [Elusimicrobia bacterium RIFCSPLOWO2_12_FULL_59_9]